MTLSTSAPTPGTAAPTRRATVIAMGAGPVAMSGPGQTAAN